MSDVKINQDLAKSLINENRIPTKPIDRVSQSVKELLGRPYCIDVHTHFFDAKCINSTYFVLRFIKDIIGIRGGEGSETNYYVEEAYKKVDVYTDDWNEKLREVLEHDQAKRGGKLGVAFRILWMNKMEKVYNYYIKDASLASYFNYDKEDVLTTVLMMDFKMSWGVNVKKSIMDQIAELKDLAKKKPVLPFLFCDPRRGDCKRNEENLYAIFNTAFANEDSFFGIKMYPGLGYDPFDYRLWPIYEICEKFEIPVLSHCGGATVTVDGNSVDVFQGSVKKTVSGDTRKDVANQLNDPILWESVLKKFPKLKLNLAHFGSDETWSSASRVSEEKDPQHRKETILRLMSEYENVYADFSYSISNTNASSNFIKVLKSNTLVQERALYGSDFWVVYNEGNLLKHQTKFLDMIGDERLVDKLCKTNSYNYLFGKND